MRILIVQILSLVIFELVSIQINLSAFDKTHQFGCGYLIFIRWFFVLFNWIRYIPHIIPRLATKYFIWLSILKWICISYDFPGFIKRWWKNYHLFGLHVVAPRRAFIASIRASCYSFLQPSFTLFLAWFVLVLD